MTLIAQTVTRFAPSPSGRLHLGHAFAALTVYRMALAENGRFVLRMEDIDQGRCRPEFVEGIYQDLEWLGLEWETPVRIQSDHFDDYARALEQLDQLEVLYPCFCTRGQIAEEIAAADTAPHGPEGALYPGTCRRLSADERSTRLATGQPHALRLDVAKAITISSPLDWREEGCGPDGEVGLISARPALLGDVVLARKDTPTSYHLSVCMDDALQGITLVVRGQDLFHATHIHCLLQDLLKMPRPRYFHHGLIRDDKGERLATRTKPMTLKVLREKGATRDQILEMIGLAPAPAGRGVG